MTKLAVSSGDPAGIGPDICIKAFGSKTELHYSPVIFGDPNLFKERAKALGQKIDLQIYRGENEELLSNNCLWIKPHNLKQSVKPGEPDIFYAKYLLDLFEDAIYKTISNEFNGLVTGPINKELMNKGGVAFQGHTEVLTKFAKDKNVLMMLATKDMRVALATTHVSLAEVPKMITRNNLFKCLTTLRDDLRAKWKIKNPCIKILGLNPHAGDGGFIGKEDQEIIAPLVSELNKEDFNIVGPVSADTAFIKKYDDQRVDAILAMFHDQGLPVIKTLGFGKIVNITLGLPFVRTSVDHGTAYDMAGNDKVDESSMLEAANLAALIASYQ
ncbi:4-hydroxythreonine-4-phosphate dehydrogenase PdxA [Gammaproteobacteria bacterium]|nr:4-hydroxythreonine-4-phosphate dehydrogenase PdxA [Gammaproteobacteria bacterium]